MRNRNFLYLLVLLAGCSPAKELVYVDLDRVPVVKEAPNKVLTPKQAATRSPVATSQSISGSASTEVENLRADEKKKIRQEIEIETKSAIATIAERLQDFYKREVDMFYLTESEKLAPQKSKLNDEYLKEVRAIFEVYAEKRGPLLTRLSFLTEFPPPEKLVPIEGEDLTKPELKKRAEIRELQRSISELDTDYDRKVEDLKAKNSAQFDRIVEDLEARLKEKQKEIDAKAEAEASRLVRRFSSGLSERIFSRYTFQLKEIPTKTVNFPQIAAQPGIPRVPFDRARLDTEDKADVARELETFLNLKRYERSPALTGARDVTAEFIEWRTNLKSGHWESWQKSSAPN